MLGRILLIVISSALQTWYIKLYQILESVIRVLNLSTRIAYSRANSTQAFLIRIHILDTGVKLRFAIHHLVGPEAMKCSKNIS